GGEFRILAQETVAGVNRVRARLAHRVENGADIEVTFRRRRGTDANGLVRKTHMRRETVRLGIDGDGGNAHPLQRLDDADGNLPAIGNQNFLEHRASDEPGPQSAWRKRFRRPRSMYER